jgi:4-amino-4-deoxy-L-arabinose transferase-like glycosyltransferase
MIARVRYKAPLYLNIAATLCGLATLAKGLAGLGLPVLVFLAFLASPGTGSGSTARRSVSRSSLAFVTCAVVAVPWHHAMLLRHGRPFWDELYGDNHWRRLVVGRHGDRGTFEYFVRELGYAMLPWITLAPAALGAASGDASRASAREAGRRGIPADARGRASSGSARSGSCRLRAGVAVGHEVPPLHPARLPGSRSRSAASSTTS